MNGFRLVIAAAVMAGIFSFGNHGLSSHGPGAFLAAAADLDAGEGHTHDHDEGHGHDHDLDEDSQPGHVHGHNPLDHSHVTMSPATAVAELAGARDTAWHDGPPRESRGAPPYFLERPPRSGPVV